MSALIKSATLQDAFKVARSGKVRNILLAGPPGVGKTTFAFLLADLLKKPSFKVQYHAEATPAELFGMYVPKENSFEWMSGPLDEAYAKGGILIHDEIVEASGPCKTFLYGALDNGRGGEIAYIGRSFKPKSGMMNVATMNGWPYEGGLPEALLDRFDATFIITQPSKKQLDLLEPDLRQICADAYESAKDPMIGPAMTFRVLMSFQTLRGLLPLEQAVLSACHGNEKVAGSFLEVLALGGDGDDGLEDDDDA
jgi:MoxR-like ATPase